MKEKTLYWIWGMLYLLCGGLGFIGQASGFGLVVLVLLVLAFFVPGAMLLYRAIRKGDRAACNRIRRISFCSLALTLLLTVLNLLSVNGSQLLGDLLYGALALVSVPMLCGRFWWMSLFLWGCLMTASLLYAPKKAK